MTRQDSYRSLLNIPGLSPLLVAATCSRLAGRMFVLTLVLFVLARFSSPELAGWLTFAAIVPGLVVSPVAGAILDRVGPTIAVRIDFIASAIFVAAVSAVGWSGSTNPVVLAVPVVLYSLTGPLGAAGTRTLLPRVVPPAALDRANALDTAIYAVVDVVGPALAGVMAASLGPAAAILLIATAYASAAVFLSFVPHLPGLVRSRASIWRQTMEGIRMVAAQPTLRGLAISYSLYQVTWGALIVVVPTFVAEHVSKGAASSITGLMWTTVGAAGGVSALLAGHLRTVDRERRIMAVGMAATAAAAWPVAGEFGLGGLVAALIVVGIASGPIDVALLTLRQRRTDPRQLGRVMSISMSLNVAGFPIGSAIAGTLTATSSSAALMMAGIASAMAALATSAIPHEIAQVRTGKESG
ncbi:MFS transporter [Burkholderia ubonensis]|uniref:MFS transporter n=1 Tax=Burkholderia ubonensis TaxID=101571 RepID=A0AAW3MNL0_9BURK|nr:MFS transporter [Burkholderia ubonensis]KVP86152.1 MFS transporter [Burkholderia ubonensis]KVU48399.1 MFS transporter [Burkholderia ubonensis]KWA03525.1 MFS transporter [Burkholderia ubonensis]KWD47042.1 MFS transporter [Burkholderia ubonensis]KWD71896.1 MFS transporter [Burkholderia ubonensis]